MRQRNAFIKIFVAFFFCGVLIFLSTTTLAQNTISILAHPFIRGISRMRAVLGFAPRASLEETNHTADEQARFTIETLRAENSRLKALLGFSTSHGLHLKGARVLLYSHDFGKEFLKIDQGEQAGVQLGDMAIDASGFLVGVITNVNTDVSTIEIASNSGMSFEVELIPSAIKSLAKGIGAATFSLEFIPRNSQIQLGDFVTLHTSGTTFLLGEIAVVRPARDGIFQTAEAVRAVRPEILREVGILLTNTFKD